LAIAWISPKVTNHVLYGFQATLELSTIPDKQGLLYGDIRDDEFSTIPRNAGLS
jgi:hypothetical protein